MTFQDLLDTLKDIGPKPANTEQDVRLRLTKDKAIWAIYQMCPRRRLTEAEKRQERKDALCAHDRYNIPTDRPNLEAEIDETTLRGIAIGLYNLALKAR